MAKLDYNDWLPKESKGTRHIDTKPRKMYNFNSTKPFEFRSCSYCFDKASFTCIHCNVYYCANEECKRFHEDEHVLARLGGGRNEDDDNISW